MNKWPENLEKYAETAVFDMDSVPAKLTRDHDTKEGIWGLVVVQEGSLDYIVSGPPETTQTVIAGGSAQIFPQVKHRVRLNSDTRFKVEFYRQPSKETVS